MGACASRPKGLKKGAPLPSEAPLSPKKPEVADPTPLQEKKDEGETTKTEEPIVDVSEVAAPEATTKVEEAEDVPVVVDKPAVEEKAAVKEEVVVAEKTEESSDVKL